MSWACGTTVQRFESTLDCRSDLQVILLKMHEVAVAVNTDICELHPLVVLVSHLLKELDEAVIIPSMRASISRKHDEWDLADFGEFVDGARLETARAFLWQIRGRLLGSDSGAVLYRWVILERRVGEAARASKTVTSTGSRARSDRGEGVVARLDIDTSTKHVWTLVRPERCVGAASGVTERV